MAKTVTVSLTESQVEFVKSEALYPLFCAGFASGKSHVMGFCAVMDAMHSSSCVIGVYEPDYSLIKNIAIPRVCQWLDEFGFKYRTHQQDHAIYTSSSGIGDFQFKSMENPESIVGYETYRSHIDEFDTLPMDKAEAVFYKILGRNRQTPKDVPQERRRWIEKNQRFEVVNRISSYSTPEGFKFCHKMWEPSGDNALSNPEFKIYLGRTQDNPTLTEQYIEELKKNYPPALVRAYMEGEFVNLESGTVYHTFDRIKHFTPRTIARTDTLHIGCDFNVGKTCGIVFVDHEGKTSIVAEVVNKYDTPDLIQEIRTRWPNHKIVIYPDASGVKRTTTNAASSDISLLKAAGFEVRAHGSNPRIKDRVACVNKLFADNTLWVNTVECPEVTKCLEQQSYDKSGDPDKKSGYDHALDGLGYRVHYSFNIKKSMFQIPFSFAQKR